MQITREQKNRLNDYPISFTANLIVMETKLSLYLFKIGFDAYRPLLIQENFFYCHSRIHAEKNNEYTIGP